MGYMYQGEYYPDDDELAHFGIKGMKWGKHKKKIMNALNDAGKKIGKAADAADKYIQKNGPAAMDKVGRAIDSAGAAGIKGAKKAGKVIAKYAKQTYKNIKKQKDDYEFRKKVQTSVSSKKNKNGQYSSAYTNANGKSSVPQAKQRKTYKAPYSPGGTTPKAVNKTGQYKSPYANTGGKSSVKAPTQHRPIGYTEANMNRVKNRQEASRKAKLAPAYSTPYANYKGQSKSVKAVKRKKK